MAQNPYVKMQGANEVNGGMVISQPRTTLAVDVEVSCEKVVAGPYARYAQKFLGVRPSLADKTTWSVKGAQVSLLDDRTAYKAEAPAPRQEREVLHAESFDDFPRMPIDKNSMQFSSPESAAEAAAATIYSLRRHRMELITGEAGENVFGGGLEAALNEINRLEQAYLELFLGKLTVTTETRRFVVCPESSKKQYVVCRISPTAGLLPASDLSGDMILLQIEPSGNIADEELRASDKESNVVTCRVADPSVCIVMGSEGEYARAVLPVFEFGRTIRVAAPRRK